MPSALLNEDVLVPVSIHVGYKHTHWPDCITQFIPFPIGGDLLVCEGLFIPSLGSYDQVIQTVAVHVADHRIAGFLLEKRHLGPFCRVSHFLPSWVEEDVPSVGDVIDVAVLIEVSDPGVLAFAVFFELDEIGPELPYPCLARVEVKSTVPAFLEVHEYVQIAIAIPVVVIETVRTVIVRIRLDDVHPPTVRPGLANMLFPFGFPVVLLFLGECGVNRECEEKCEE